MLRAIPAPIRPRPIQATDSGIPDIVFLREIGSEDILMRRDCIAVLSGSSAETQKPNREEKRKTDLTQTGPLMEGLGHQNLAVPFGACSDGKFFVSWAGKAYDSRDSGPNRKFRLRPRKADHEKNLAVRNAACFLARAGIGANHGRTGE